MSAFLNTRHRPTNPQAVVVGNGDMPNPPGPLSVKVDEAPDAIEVEFTNAPVDQASVIANQTFFVVNALGAQVPGQVVHMPGNIARWARLEAATVTEGDYRVVLVGNGTTTIVGPGGLPLDGEPRQLPSGNDQGGGNFVFVLQVR